MPSTSISVSTSVNPGKSIGYEFIYPRQQALQLAKATSEPVLTTRAESKDVVTADLARIDGSGVPAPVVVEEAPAPVAATGRAQQGEVAPGGATAIAGPDTRADERVRSTARTELPQTATSMPLIMLLSVLAMCAGIALWWGFAKPSPRRV